MATNYPQSIRLTPGSKIALDVLLAKARKEYPTISIPAVINAALIAQAKAAHEHKSRRQGCEVCEALYA